MRRTTPPGEEFSEKCSLCRRSFAKEELIIREVGDYKLFFFCFTCIENLFKEVIGNAKSAEKT